MFNITTIKTCPWRWRWVNSLHSHLTIYFTKSIWTLSSRPPWRWKQKRYEDVKMIHNPFSSVINFSYIKGIAAVTNLYRTGTCQLKGQLLLWVPQQKSWQWASSPFRLNSRSVWSHYSQRKMKVHEFQDSALTFNFHKIVSITVMHCIGHAFNFYSISTQTSDDLTCLFRNFFHS